jgi:hypothetical protein
MRQSIRANGEFMPGAAYDCVGTSFNTNQALKSTVAFLSSSWRHFQKSFEDNKDLLESFIGRMSGVKSDFLRFFSKLLSKVQKLSRQKKFRL